MLVAIDPGAAGGIAISTRGIVSVQDLVKQQNQYAQQFSQIAGLDNPSKKRIPVYFVIETVGQFHPLQKGADLDENAPVRRVRQRLKQMQREAGMMGSILKLRENYGRILGNLDALKLTYETIRAADWQRRILPERITDYASRKQAFWDVARKEYPNLKFKKTQADALCILLWACREYPALS